ncbi:hypothetical protein CPG37_07280 [Malaciobacter canalis]|uniref:Protein kinase domain-containing protein n=1 Tax=Malaciobacter canalis TaxID=1912871 RepID=A0ABX4LPH5_9BACT|nr:YrbL family protein [Malaciobacter canalis]PHO09807.1 hypothetical protein CPG37_07280 [Malaciobacter canalis]QEE33426.1 YrbL family protein [Malaciobacter canalis]
MNEKVILSNKYFLAKGGERDCYIYPNNKTKLIKILYSKEALKNHQNRLDYIYFKHLEKKGKDISKIAKCYDFVNTNLGEGLIFDRIMDYDGVPSKSFRYLVAHNLLTREEQKRLLKDLKTYLEKNKILFHDNSMTNIFYKKLDKNKATLVIVDGLGAKRLGLKFWLYRNVPFYRNYKIKKQWKKLMFLYNKDITRIDNGTMPMSRL